MELQEAKEKTAQVVRMTAEMAALGTAAKEASEAAERIKALEKDINSLTKENKQLVDNFNSERVSFFQSIFWNTVSWVLLGRARL